MKKVIYIIICISCFVVQSKAQNMSVYKDDNPILTISHIDFDKIIFSPDSDKKIIVLPDTIKILAIGNSFSQDAVEAYLYPMFEAANIPVRIGSIPISSCSLARHLENAKNKDQIYPMYVIDENGKRSLDKKVSIDDAMNYDTWTHVSIQQVSELSGMYETYQESLPALIYYLRSIMDSSAKLMFHQTWAYSEDCERVAYANYSYDQMVMYNAIMDATKKAMEDCDIDILIPCGTAIQNARTSPLGDNLNRDGFHLDLNIGRFVASSTWFETITGRSALFNTYMPNTIGLSMKFIAGISAKSAVENPFSITPI